MASTFVGKVTAFFQLLCVTAAIALVIWCTIEYSKNEDISEVTFKRFMDGPDSIYPDISVCVYDRFNESRLKEYDQNFTASSYAQFVGGKIWNAKMVKVDYEYVSLNIHDHFIAACAQPNGHDLQSCVNKTEITTFNFPGYSGFNVKCFSFQPQTDNQQQLTLLYLAFKTSIFPKGTRPASWGFFVLFHYHQQLTRSATLLQRCLAITRKSNFKIF